MKLNALLFRCCTLATLGFILACNSQPKTPASPDLEQSITSDTIPIATVPAEILPTAAPEGWTNLQRLIPDAVYDIRYATENNFVGEQLYPCPTCWLRPAAAEAALTVANTLREEGYRMILFDCYRPLPIQERLWAIKPDATYVTPPTRGSMHNRGLAVDIGLADMDGNELNMGTPFDYFGRPAHHDFTGHPKEIQARRDLLKETMISAGFGPIRTEWWHYSYKNTKAALSREQWPCPDSNN